MKIQPPPPGKLYHGVYASTDEGSPGPDNTWDSLLQYRQAISGDEIRNVAWVYVNNNWDNPDKSEYQVFPAETANWISTWNGTNQHPAVPFIRLWMISKELRQLEQLEWEDPAQRATRIQEKRGLHDPTYSLDRIVAGHVDEQLHAWAIAAKNFGRPLMVEWGGECNGWWTPWNARQYGGNSCGTELYRQAYRHIVSLVRDAGADNITWVFHIVASDNPDVAHDGAPWNALENYYPGDEFIDWIGISVYGPQFPQPDAELVSFSGLLEDTFDAVGNRVPGCISRLKAMAPEKPIAIAEFGCAAAIPVTVSDTDDASGRDTYETWLQFDQRAAVWAQHAVHDMFHRWRDDIRGFSWWNEGWTNGEDPPSEMRVQHLPQLAHQLRESFNYYEWTNRLLDRVRTG